MDAKHRRRKEPAHRSTVSATEAAKNFGELVDRVREAGVPYIVERKGRPIVEIAPVSRRRCSLAELAEWLESRKTLHDAFTTAVARHVKAVNRPRVPESRWGR